MAISFHPYVFEGDAIRLKTAETLNCSFNYLQARVANLTKLLSGHNRAQRDPLIGPHWYFALDPFPNLFTPQQSSPKGLNSPNHEDLKGV